MEQFNLGCQVCLTIYYRVHQLKKHLGSTEHRQKMSEVFNKETFSSRGFFPHITGLDPQSRQEIKQPILGLSLMTLCFSPDINQYFYMCHVCEEKCLPNKIAQHLSSIDHCRNYFSYTNPNALSFSWFAGMDFRVNLRPLIEQEDYKTGPGELQLLDLPMHLLKTLASSTYSEAMSTLSENEKLLKRLEAKKPKRMMIQTYQRDSNRKHPLVGLQHLVECVCVGLPEKRFYLCTLCCLTLATRMVIKHVLSFDHLFCYFKVWHPSTLLSKESYYYNLSFASKMHNFAKKTEEIHGSAMADMKQVSLEPAKYTSVSLTCYTDALKELESFRKENQESSLITVVKPGNKLGPVSTVCQSMEYKLCCQNCSVTFGYLRPYCFHVSTGQHRLMLERFFVGAANCFDQTAWTPNLGLYDYHKERLRKHQPLIGLSLVVTCVSTGVEEEPIYICFACEDCFSESSLKQHFDSPKHLIHTLLYQNPWLLTFGWKHCLDVKLLQSMALKEEKERGPKQMRMKVLDIPHWEFHRLISLCYPQVMARLQPHHSLLKRDVPQRETYSKCQQNEKFPLLGTQFIVLHDIYVGPDQPTEKASLCLLCQRRLSADECYAHVFSWEHVAKYLNSFHPGSLDSSADTGTLLDLAKQAAGSIFPGSQVQVINLDKPIWEPCSYAKAKSILASAKRRHGLGKLEHPIVPKGKLVPRETQKEVNKDHMGEETHRTEGGGETMSQKSTDIAAEVTHTQCLESGENAEKVGDKETPTQIVKESEEAKAVVSKTTSEACPVIKEEVIEETLEGKQSGDNIESSQKMVKKEEGKDKSESSIDILTQEIKTSQNTCPVEDLKQEQDHKRQRLTSKEDTSCEEPRKLPSSVSNESPDPDVGEKSDKPVHQTVKKKASSDMKQQDQLWQYLKRTSREPVIGLNALLECHCDERNPIYLCECCSLTIPEENVICHVTGVKHQKMYLMGLQKPPGWHPGMTISQLAALCEQENGYGMAQVVDLDDKIYDNISKLDFKSAVQTVKALWDQQDTVDGLPSTSALSGVQPVDTSVSLQAQHELCSGEDDHQVVEMEIDDDPADSEAIPTSVKTETTSNTTEVPPESTNPNMTHIRESSDNANTGQNVSRRRENNAEIISSPLGALTMETTSKTMRSSQTVTHPNTCMTVSSKSAAESSSSAPDTTKSTAPSPKPTAPASCCTLDTTKSRETAQGCTAPTSVCTATTSKFTSSTSSATTSTTKSAALSKPVESKSGAAAKVPAPSYKASNAEAASASKVENASKKSAATSSATSKMLVKCENTDVSVKTAHVKNPTAPTAEVAPNTHKNKPPAAPHPTARSKNKNPHTEPSHMSASKTKPSETPKVPKVGVNQLIQVTCGEKQQFYCQLCSCRLLNSKHTVGETHQSNYVKMKFPGWTATPAERDSKLSRMVSHLAEVEKHLGLLQPQKLEVKIDVYRELAFLPGDKGKDILISVSSRISAIERLTAMLGQRESVHTRPSRSSHSSRSSLSSPSTHDPAALLNRQVSSASSFEASSPDDGMSQNEGCSTDDQSELQTPLVQIPDIESSSKEVETQSVGAQTVKSPKPEAEELVLDQFDPSPILTENETSTSPCIDDADTQKVLEDSQKTSPVQAVNLDLPPPPAAASVNTEHQNQPSQRAAHVSRHSGQVSVEPSNLFRILGVKGREGIIGLELVWEFRAISLSYYLCESCSKMMDCHDIIPHLLSYEHKYNYIQWKHQKFLYWQEDDYLPCMKVELFDEITELLSKRELNTDVQCILMGPDSYEHVRTAPFSEALNIVKSIKNGTHRHSPLRIRIPRQKGATQQPEKHYLEETVGDLDGAKQRRVSSPLDMSSISSRTGAVVSPVPAAGTGISPQEQPKPRPPVFQAQSLAPEPVEQAEVHSLPSSIVSPETLSVSPRDEGLPTRKRPAGESVETLIRSCTNNPELERPLPAKYKNRCSPSPESSSEFTSVNHTANSTCLSSEDIKRAYDQQAIAILSSIITMMRQSRSANNGSSTPKNGTTKCADDSPQSGVETISDPPAGKAEKTKSWDSKWLPLKEVKQSSSENNASSAPNNDTTTSTEDSSQSGVGTISDQTAEMAKKTKSWDSKWLPSKEVSQSRSENNASSAPNNDTTKCANNSSQSGVETILEMAKKTKSWDSKWLPLKEAKDSPSVSGHEDQLLTTDSSSLEGSTSSRSDPLLGAAEAEAVHTVADDPSHPQHQRSVDAQSKSTPSPAGYVGQTPQQQDNTETCDQLPINPIISVRQNSFKHQLKGYYNKQDHTVGNMSNPVTHTVAAVRPSDAAYAYVTNGQPGYFPPEAAGSYAAPGNLPVHTGSSYQREEYTITGFYPDQGAYGYSLPAFRQGVAAQPPPPVWMGVQQQQQQQLLQQQLLQQQQQQQQQLQQQLLQQQQLLRQQYTLSASACLIAGDVTSPGTAPFTNPFLNSQTCVDLNSSNRVSVTQNSSNILTQNAQFYLNPPTFYYPPAAHTEVRPDNSFTSAGYPSVAPSVINSNPEITHPPK